MKSTVASQLAASDHGASAAFGGHQTQDVVEELSAIVASIRESLIHCDLTAHDFLSFEDFKSWWETFNHYEIQDVGLSEPETIVLEGQLEAFFAVLTGRR